MTKRFLLLAITSILLTACRATTPSVPETTDSSLRFQDTPSSPTQETDSMIGTTTISLLPNNNSGVSGTAVLEEQNGRVTVTISLSDMQAASAQTANIYMGSCTKLGEVKYPLTSLSNGTSATQLDVSMAALKGMGPLAVSVQKSACADLPTSPATGPGLATPAPTPLM